MFALNFISIELENPFGLDANDLPLSEFQKEMNDCLLMLLHPNTDLVSGGCFGPSFDTSSNLGRSSVGEGTRGRPDFVSSKTGKISPNTDDVWTLINR